MEGLLKFTVGVLALIAAAKWCNAAEENPGNVAEKKGNLSEERSGDGLKEITYTAEEEAVTPSASPIEEFWIRNEAALIYRTTYGTFNNCKWYRRGTYIESGFTLSTSIFVANTNKTRTTKTEKCKLCNLTSMLCEDVDGDQRVMYMLHQNENSTCGVNKYYYFEVAVDELKEIKEKECEDNEDAERCRGGRCKPHPDGDGTFLCKDGPFYEFLVHKEHIMSVPQDCTDYYNKTIGNKSDTENEAIETCRYTEGSR